MHLAEIEEEYNVYLDDKLPFVHNLGRDIKIFSYFDDEEKEDLYNNIVEAFRNECQKYYEDSADYYKKVFKKTVGKNYCSFHSYSDKLKKKFFKCIIRKQKNIKMKKTIQQLSIN